MPQKVFTVEVALWKAFFCLLFQDLLMVRLDGIPVLFVTLMEVIDGREIQIFFMPAENGLPSSNIAVRICNAFNENRSCIFQERIKIS